LRFFEQRVDAGKQRLVLVDAHAVLAKRGAIARSNGLESPRGVGSGQIEEHGGGAFEGSPECSSASMVLANAAPRVAGDCAILLRSAASPLERGHEMLDLDAIERGASGTADPRFKQRVLPGRSHLCE